MNGIFGNVNVNTTPSTSSFVETLLLMQTDQNNKAQLMREQWEHEERQKVEEARRKYEESIFKW